MVKSSDFKAEDRERDNWNVARDYTKDIIADHIIMMKKHQRTSMFGAEDFYQQYQLNEEQFSPARISALRWFLNELRMLIENTEAMIKTEQDKESMKVYFTNTLTLEKYIEKVVDVSLDQRTNKKKVVIEEKKFIEIYLTIVSLKRLVLQALYRSQLLMGFQEADFDPDKFKEEVAEDFINS